MPRFSAAVVLLAVYCCRAQDIVELGLVGGGLSGDSIDASKIRIRLRPDLSGPASADYVRYILQKPSEGLFHFYRAETWGVLQGEMSHPDVPIVHGKGPCPADVDGVTIYKTRQCFSHDPDCGCHGPAFQPGMVGWAAGAGGGPDFFIYIGNGPATAWSHDHTVWGELADRESWNLVQQMLMLPTFDNGMSMLSKPIPFQMHTHIVELSLANAQASLRGSADASKIRIRLRPDLSGTVSTDHVRSVAGKSKGGKLQFYRAETWGVLQGEMSHPDVPNLHLKGPCPRYIDGPTIYKTRQCYSHDPDCACHGPTFVKGMVGWAGGQGGGPHFFIYVGDQPATFWSHDHTVWGELADEESLELVKQVLSLPTKNNGMAMLNSQIPFNMRNDL